MKIVEAPNPVLSAVAKELKAPFPSDLPRMLKYMERALLSAKDPKGVGLAAPQVGLGLRIFITRPADKSKTQVFINPKILATGKKQLAASQKPEAKSKKPARGQKKLEGCLSLPSIWGAIKRSPVVKLSYLDENGKSHTKTFSGFMAIIAQHEI